MSPDVLDIPTRPCLTPQILLTPVVLFRNLSLFYRHLQNAWFYSYSALTEKIVGALKRMKCPHRIEPHQIQGLDFIHIFPVVQVHSPLYEIQRSLLLLLSNPCSTRYSASVQPAVNLLCCICYYQLRQLGILRKCGSLQNGRGLKITHDVAHIILIFFITHIKSEI